LSTENPGFLEIQFYEHHPEALFGGLSMARSSSDEKQQAHQLIDQLPPSQLSAVVGLLEAMLEPFEEREISPETIAAMDRARASLARGEGIPHGEVLPEFGLKQ
jgi:hypothetical protein